MRLAPIKLFILFSCSFSTASVAQIINIDKTDTSAYIKKAIWKGNIAAGSEIDKQRTTLFDVSNFADVSLQQYKDLFIPSASNRFTYNGSQDFLNAGYAHLRWRHNYKATWHPEHLFNTSGMKNGEWYIDW